MSKRSFRLLAVPAALAALAALAAAGWLLLRRPLPRHIFLITLDTMRADAIDTRSGAGSATPNLAALAGAGVRFVNAYSVIPITTPSHAAMFYSLPPHALKQYNNGQRLEAPYPSLAEIMKRGGFATGAVVSLAVLKREFGLDRGFDRYEENFRPFLWYRSAEEVNRDAFALIRRLKGGKSFVWLHYSDPHEPYFPPGGRERFTVSCAGRTLFSGPSSEQPVLRLGLDLRPGTNVVTLDSEPPEAGFTSISFSDLRVDALEPGTSVAMEPSSDLRSRSERYGRVSYSTTAARSSLNLTVAGNNPCRAELAFKYQLKTSDEAMRRGYRREVAYLDGQIGRLIAFLKREGLFETSAFLVLGDHGEGLGEYNGHFGHIHYLNPVYTHVPFFVSGRGVRGGGESRQLVSNLNVAPTLLALAGIPARAHMTGRDALKGGGDARLFMETYSPEAYFDSFAVVRFPWQLVFQPGRRDGQMEFYDLAADPLGSVDLQARPDPSAQRPEMTAALLRLSRAITSARRRLGGSEKKTMDTLKTLGYL
jgi:arylsulfatase A-like enzyme